MVLIGKVKISVGPYYNVVDEDKCVGCQVYISVCPYNAITLNERGISEINPAIYKCCGTCTSCPNSAVSSQHYTDSQITAMIQEYLSNF